MAVRPLAVLPSTVEEVSRAVEGSFLAAQSQAALPIKEASLGVVQQTREEASLVVLQQL